MFKAIKNYFIKKSLQGSIIPYVIVIFFFIIVAVNVVYIIIASKSWRGVAVEDSYNKGVNYNQTIEQAEKQKDLDWKINYRYRNLSKDKKNGRFIFIITDGQNKIVEGALITIEFKRPTQEGYDFFAQSSFEHDYYYVDARFAVLGNWEANITVQKDKNIFFEKRKLFIQ